MPSLSCAFLSSHVFSLLPPLTIHAGADAYADGVLHNAMSEHSVGKAYLSACLHVTAVLGREAILPRGVVAPGSTGSTGSTSTVGAAVDADGPGGEAQAAVALGSSRPGSAGSSDGESDATKTIDKALLKELRAEQVAALRYLGIEPRKSKDKGKRKGTEAQAAADAAPAVVASTAAAVPSQPAAAPAARLQLGVKRLDLLPRPRSDVLLVDCNPAAAAVFPGNTLLLPPLEVVRDFSEGGHSGSGDAAGSSKSAADEENGLLGRGIAAAARLFGSEGASSAAPGQGPWLDVEASPEAGVRRMNLALAQRPPDVPTTLVVSAAEAAASAAASAEAAKRIAIATGRATDADSSDTAPASAASSGSASSESESELDRERGDLELLADMVSLYRTAAAARLLTLRRARQQGRGSSGDALSAPGVSRVLSHAGSIESWLSYIKSRGVAVNYRFADGHDAGGAGRQDAYDPYMRSHAALVAVLRMKEAASAAAAP